VLPHQAAEISLELRLPTPVVASSQSWMYKRPRLAGGFDTTIRFSSTAGDGGKYITLILAFGLGPAVELGFKICRVKINRYAKVSTDVSNPANAV
jgi:hypothetical protein